MGTSLIRLTARGLTAALAIASYSAISHADDAQPARRVESMRVDPHGRVSGFILADGTDLRASLPDQLAASTAPGDLVRAPLGARGSFEVENLRTGRFVPIADIASAARGGGPQPVGATAKVGEYPLIDDASKLDRLATSGRVRSMLRSPNGMPTGFVMDNGAQVFTVPTVADGVVEQVRPGDEVRVEGRGTKSAHGTGMWAVAITRGNAVLLDMMRGVGAPELNLR